MKNIFLIISKPQKLISEIIEHDLLKDGFFIWIISTISSYIIEIFTGFNEKGFASIYNSYNINIYLKVILFFIDSILDILLIAFLLNICAMLFKRKSAYLKIFTSLLYVEVLYIYIFPLQLILLLIEKTLWINYSIYFINVLEVIFIMKAIKAIYKIDKLRKAIFIFILGILLYSAIYLMIHYPFKNNIIKQSELYKTNSNNKHIICEIETKDYNQFSDKYYKINCLVTVKILDDSNKNFESYYCSIIKDCVIATIHTYISMNYANINKIDLKEYIISNCNSFLINQNIEICELIFEVVEDVTVSSLGVQ